MQKIFDLLVVDLYVAAKIGNLGGGFRVWG